MYDSASKSHTALLPSIHVQRRKTTPVTLENFGALVAEKKFCQDTEQEELQEVRQNKAWLFYIHTHTSLTLSFSCYFSACH